MKTTWILLLATVIPLGWVVLGAILLWRFAVQSRANKTTLAFVPEVGQWLSTEMLSSFEWNGA